MNKKFILIFIFILVSCNSKDSIIRDLEDQNQNLKKKISKIENQIEEESQNDEHSITTQTMEYELHDSEDLEKQWERIIKNRDMDFVARQEAIALYLESVHSMAIAQNAHQLVVNKLILGHILELQSKFHTLNPKHNKYLSGKKSRYKTIYNALCIELINNNYFRKNFIDNASDSLFNLSRNIYHGETIFINNANRDTVHNFLRHISSHVILQSLNKFTTSGAFNLEQSQFQRIKKILSRGAEQQKLINAFDSYDKSEKDAIIEGLEYANAIKDKLEISSGKNINFHISIISTLKLINYDDSTLANDSDYRNLQMQIDRLLN
ncbi:MAG: hypothetical protein N4A33_12230 [Bacteriovoracaceae bacterium]|jgi:hypothetical protein|nr:hypothetical protein [Bacteriovoracaceae bacterium]